MAAVRTFAQLQNNAGVAILLPQFGGNTAAAVAGAALQAIALDAFVFQYFPETLEDTQGAEYEETQIPGGSHPLYQWISGGARKISFQAKFSSERINPPPAIDVMNRYNVDINGVMAALRYFHYPLYDQTAALRARPPIRLWLIIPGTFLGGLVPPVPVILTELSFTIESWHAVTVPRQATANLTFNEIRQSATGGVRFVGRDNFQITKQLYNPLTARSRRAFT